MDNQIYDCVFPVIFFPVPPPKSVAVEDHGTAGNKFSENDIFVVYGSRKRSMVWCCFEVVVTSLLSSSLI